MLTYIQRTGNWYSDAGTLLVSGCYAGGNEGKNPEGVNNPAMDHIHNVGPICRGFYTIGKPYDHTPAHGFAKNLGPYVMDLTPDTSNEMYGRGEFKYHGWSARDHRSSSEGCICKSPLADRKKIGECGDTRLRVVAEESDRVSIPA